MAKLVQTTDGKAHVSPFALKAAGLFVKVCPLYGDVARLCQDYLVPLDEARDADVTVATTPADIEREQAAATEGSWPAGYLETLHVLRSIAEAAPARRRLLVHGAAIAYDGHAYLFCAPSGTGKSTHLALWRELLGAGARVINGDKPIVELPQEGVPVVHGTPWAGKEGWNLNASAPLGGICFVQRAGQGPRAMERLTPAEALGRMMASIYLPQDREAALLTLGLADELMAKAPLWLMHADISLDAARMSFRALTGSPEPEATIATRKERT